MESARPARHDDRAAIARLLTDARADLDERRGGALWGRREAPTPEATLDAIDRPDHLLVVGTIDAVVVGYGLVEVETLGDATMLARLIDLYVDAEARGVGVGEQIIAVILAFAAERGCFGIDAVALPGDRATKNFFETHGLVARSIIVHRSLPPA